MWSHFMIYLCQTDTNIFDLLYVAIMCLLLASLANNTSINMKTSNSKHSDLRTERHNHLWAKTEDLFDNVNPFSLLLRQQLHEFKIHD